MYDHAIPIESFGIPFVISSVLELIKISSLPSSIEHSTVVLSKPLLTCIVSWEMYELFITSMLRPETAPLLHIPEVPLILPYRSCTRQFHTLLLLHSHSTLSDLRVHHSQNTGKCSSAPHKRSHLLQLTHITLIWFYNKEVWYSQLRLIAINDTIDILSLILQFTKLQ